MDPQTAANLQKFGQMIQALIAKQGGGGQQQNQNPLLFGGRQGGLPPQMTGATPGQPPPQTEAPGASTPPQAPKITFDPSGAGATMQKPAAQPMSPGYSPSPLGSEMMSKLDPKGAAVYSALEGVQKLIGQYQQKKDQKQQAEAQNIAQNLMAAMESGDQAEVAAIMNDPKATKLLNKVYKGWLTPAPQEKPKDPDAQAFEQGVADYVRNKQGGGQTPPQGGAPPQGGQPQGAPQGGMPRQMGGYMLPQSAPQQLLDAAVKNAQLQAGKQDPTSLLGGPMTPERVKEQAKLEAQVQIAATDYQKALTQAKTAETLLQRATVSAQAAGEKEKAATEAAAQKAVDDHMKAMANLDLAKQKYLNLQQQGKNIAARGAQQQQQPPPTEILKMNAIDKAEDLIDQVTARGKGFTMSDVQSLQQELKAGGASALAEKLPGYATIWLRGQGTVDDMKAALDTYRDGHTKMLQERYPAWKGAGSLPSADKTDDDTTDDSTDDTTDEGETVIELGKP